jgi:hypothetical protein
MSHVAAYSGRQDHIGHPEPTSDVGGKAHLEIIADLRHQLREAAKFLRKYQARYHGAEHAQKLWQSVDAWLKENQP